jgi:hypothetical protein
MKPGGQDLCDRAMVVYQRDGAQWACPYRKKVVRFITPKGVNRQRVCGKS